MAKAEAGNCFILNMNQLRWRLVTRLLVLPLEVDQGYV